MRPGSLACIALLAACHSRGVDRVRLTDAGLASAPSAASPPAQPSSPPSPPPPPASPECASALAAETSPWPPPPQFERFTLELEGKGATRQVAAPDRFVLAARDGRTVAVFSKDAMDFTGWLVQTLRLLEWPRSRGQRSLELYVGGEGDEPNAKAKVEARARALEQARLLLAAREWQTAVRGRRPSAPCEGSRWAALDRARTTAAADGAAEERVVRFDAAHLDIELVGREDEPTSLHFRKRTSSGEQVAVMPSPFGPAGHALSGKTMTACGTISGIEDAYLLPNLDVLVLFPSASLGGDMCFGKLAVESAVLVQLPAAVR